MAPKKPDKGDWKTSYARATSLAFILPAAVFAGYAVGYLLDRQFGTSYLKIVCLILGTVGGFIQLIRDVTRGE